MLNEHCSVHLRLLAVVRSSLTIGRRLNPICCSSGSSLGGSGSVRGGASEALLRPVKDLHGGERVFVADPDGVASVQLLVAQPGGRVARCRCRVAAAGSRIASSGDIDSGVGRVASLLGGVVAKVAGGPMNRRVASVNEVAVTGNLIFISRGLIGVGCCLVAVRS
jgi:hypothetical protein